MNPQNFLLIGIAPHYVSDSDIVKEMKEAKSLVDAFGGKVCDFVIQRREVHDKGLFIGRGKIEEVSEIVKKEKIDVVVLNAIVKPSHIFAIKNMLQKASPKVLVWDRADLILEIFAKHAHTAEAKLQIELASMRHMGPRIYGMGHIMSRQAGGIGTLGVGETNTELMKRHWRVQMRKVEAKLKKLTADRERQVERRQKNNMKTISIIGYTNAGKTSLFNHLTGKKNIADNALFVTLDSSVGKLFLPKSRQEVLLTDTIGFISNLPTRLVDAFRSTLLESLHADLLIHVIDASDENMEKKIAVVENVLWELGIQEKNRLYVFNKLDRTNGMDVSAIVEEYAQFHPLCVSVKKEDGLEKLLMTLEENLFYKAEEQQNPKRKRVHY